MAERGGDGGAGAATRSKGEPAYPMSYIGAGEGLRPLRTPDRGERSPGPSITPAAPFSLSHDCGLDGARSDGEAFDGVLTPLNPPALPGRLDFLTPWHTRTPRNASWSDSPLRDRRSRRLWGNRTDRLIRPDLGSARWPSRQGSLWRERPRNGEGRWWILACTTSPCPVPHQRQKIGGRSLHFLPLLSGATTRRARGGHAMPALHGALRQRTRAIRANPRPMRIPGHNLDHNGEGFAL